MAKSHQNSNRFYSKMRYYLAVAGVKGVLEILNVALVILVFLFFIDDKGEI